MRPRVRIVIRTGDEERRLRELPGERTLGAALAELEILLLEPLDGGLAGLPLRGVRFQPVPIAEVPAGATFHRSTADGRRADGGGGGGAAGPVSTFKVTAQPSQAPGPSRPERLKGGHPRPERLKGGHPRPEQLTEGLATALAYSREIEHVAGLLRADLSVLVLAEKLVVRYVWEAMVRAAGREHEVLSVPAEEDRQAEPGMFSMPVDPRQRQLARLRELLLDLKDGQVLVLPHLDLLAGTTDGRLPQEARELVDLLYEAPKPILLAFADPTLPVAEVLAGRFSVRVEIKGSPQTVIHPEDGVEQPLGDALVTVAEAERFTGFDAVEFHKYVAGMNPVRLRQAMRYAVRKHEGVEHVTMEQLRDTIREFKVQISASFEVPKVTFDDIGGYDEVKHEILRALRVISDLARSPDVEDRLRHELVPHGFIFYGPPGTGKTLFAKAIASAMNATIQVVSGPEVTDMYVGESERKVRELFAEARRNAPAVLVFDEFDSIAAKRSGREDGGARVGNAIVAQILTEMDGFRPAESILVIGTTNRLELIDEALLRPSRFQSVPIDLPDETARAAIVRVHARRYGIDVGGGLVELISRATEGRNGDEIRSIFRDALVGARWEGREPDAERLGELVGRLHRSHRQLQSHLR